MECISLKETGIIRKIDELGRIVLPKEIRKNLGIKDGEDLEIFVRDKGVYLQKYSHLLNITDTLEPLCNLAFEVMGLKLIVTDREQVITAFDSSLVSLSIPSSLEEFIMNRECYTTNQPAQYFNLSGYFHIEPINVSGDIMGLILLYQEQPFLSYMIDFTRFLTKIIVNKIDIL